MKTSVNAVEYIFSLYEKHGKDDYIGEDVTQLEHMSQAAELALRDGQDDEVILAAFFHDIGHICAVEGTESMNGYGTMDHETIGANFLSAHGFPEKVVKLVASHVQAKRYLTHKYPAYYDSMSEASKKTLVFQGGVMTHEEAELFEKDELFELILRLRQYDELAKEKSKPLINMDILKKTALRVLEKNGNVYS